MRAHLYAYLLSPEINHFTHLTPPHAPYSPPTPPHAPYSPLLSSYILLSPTPLMHLTPPYSPSCTLLPPTPPHAPYSPVAPPPYSPLLPSKKRVERYLIYYHTNTLCKQVDENHGINIVWGVWGCDSELYKYWNDNSR